MEKEQGILGLCIKATLIFGLIAHAFRYFNTMFSHDSVTRIYIEESLFEWKIGLGRFAHVIYMPIRNLYAVPWLIGILSLIYIALAAFFLLRLFGVNNKYIVILMTGILATNYSLTLINATFIYVSDVYMLAILLYVIAAYLVIKYKYGFLGGSLCLAIALGLYQAFVPVVPLLILFWTLFEAYNNQQLRYHIILLVKSVLMLVVSYFLYNFILDIFLVAFGVELSTAYNGIDAVGDFSEHNIFMLISDTYEYVFDFFITKTAYNVKLLIIIGIILAMILIGALIRAFLQLEISVINRIIILLCVIAFPFVLNCVYFISKGMIHHLMIYPFCFTYIFFLLVMDFLTKKQEVWNIKLWRKVKFISYFLICIVIFRSCVYSNDVYLKKQLEYETTQMLFNRIISEIEEVDGYEVSKNTELVFIGLLENSPLYMDRFEFSALDDASGLSEVFSVTNYPKYKPYFEYILNYPIRVADKGVMEQYKQKSEVEDMPVFPYEGSVKFVDDKIVVKISE